MAHMQPSVTHNGRYLAHASQMTARLASADVEGDIRKLVVAGMNYIRGRFRTEWVVAAQYLYAEASLSQRARGNNVPRLHRRRLVRRHRRARYERVQPGHIQSRALALDSVHKAGTGAAHIEDGGGSRARQHRIAERRVPVPRQARHMRVSVYLPGHHPPARHIHYLIAVERVQLRLNSRNHPGFHTHISHALKAVRGVQHGSPAQNQVILRHIPLSILLILFSSNQPRYVTLTSDN